MMEFNMTEEELIMFNKFKAMLALEQSETNEPNSQQKKKRRITKHRRSRGTGTITKLSGNRSKPFAARITSGHDNNTGSQVQKTLGYFETYRDAEIALNEYYVNKNGLAKDKDYLDTVKTTSDKKTPTFKELWEIINEEQLSKKSYSTIVNYKTACKHLKSIWHKPINTITLHDLQPIFDVSMKEGSGKSKLNFMKGVCTFVFAYAMKYDYINKDYSKFITFEDTGKSKKERRTFTKEEISELFKVNTLSSKILLIYIYTGMRPQELLNVKPENVHLDDNYIIGGIKTKNGIDRIIPIHNCIKLFIGELLKQNKKYLVFDFQGRKAYERYRSFIFKSAVASLKTNHEPYESRHTFATMCNEYSLNDFLVKKMMGHSCKDLTLDVYTHATIERLVSEINKLPDFSKDD